MASKKDNGKWKVIKFTINVFTYQHKLKAWADENDMTVRAAIRYIINQFFKDKSY